MPVGKRQAAHRTNGPGLALPSPFCAVGSGSLIRRAIRVALEHDADSMNRHHALGYCSSIAFAENRFPLFGAML
jgi:hypothetical protein